MPASPEAHAAALTLADHRALRAQALRLCRRADEAEDLVQETLLAGVLAGRHDMPWLSGVLRRQAAMAARSGARRRRLEALAGLHVEAVIETHRAELAGLFAARASGTAAVEARLRPVLVTCALAVLDALYPRPPA